MSCFCQHWNIARTSVLHPLQNSLEIFCNLLQYSQQQMCGAAKTLRKGEGGMTFGFNFNRFIGLSGIMLSTSPNKSIAKSHEFTIASTSIRKVCNDSSFRLVPWVFNKKSLNEWSLHFLFGSPILQPYCWLKVDFVSTASIQCHCLSWNHDPLLVYFCKSFLKFRRSSNKITAVIQS